MVLGLAKEDSKQLTLGLVLLGMSSTCNLLLPKVAGDIVDVVGKGEPSSESELRLACLTLLGVAIF
eukprot:SAG25_NODE_2089_length_1964_cov_13.859517_1_plen_65_part_10